MNTDNDNTHIRKANTHMLVGKSMIIWLPALHLGFRQSWATRRDLLEEVPRLLLVLWEEVPGTREWYSHGIGYPVNFYFLKFMVLASELDLIFFWADPKTVGIEHRSFKYRKRLNTVGARIPNAFGIWMVHSCSVQVPTLRIPNYG